SPSRLTAQSPDEVSRLGWLSGCWELRTATRVTHEQWMSPLGGALIGMSRTVAGGALREFEYLRITRVADTLRYTAMPGGQRETRFTATQLTDSSVAFANPTHDFPQQIEYRRRGQDSLIATISGVAGGHRRAIPFAMRRTACSG
ncbi:MAG: DUF6265 family protein, partial [Gemmatimonadaceae bacterium]|nr:DUF6265 family protein [Gemmatimonadaceae bacterium]